MTWSKAVIDLHDQQLKKVIFFSFSLISISGTCGQFFVIYKLANAEEAKEMCQSKGAQLANVGAGTEYEKDSFFKLIS